MKEGNLDQKDSSRMRHDMLNGLGSNATNFMPTRAPPDFGQGAKEDMWRSSSAALQMSFSASRDIPASSLHPTSVKIEPQVLFSLKSGINAASLFLWSTDLAFEGLL